MSRVRMSVKHQDHNQSIGQDTSYKQKAQSLKTEGPVSSRSNAFPQKDRETSFASTTTKESQSYVNAMKALQDKITKLENEKASLKECLSDSLTEIKELKQIVEDIRNREQGYIQKIEYQDQQISNQSEDEKEIKIAKLQDIVLRYEREFQQYKKDKIHNKDTLSVDEFTLDQLLKEFQTSQTNFRQISKSMIYKYGSSPINHKKKESRDIKKMSSKKTETQESFTKKKKPHAYDIIRVPSFSQIEVNNETYTSFSSESSCSDNILVLREQEKLFDELKFQEKLILQKIKNLQNLTNNALADEMRSNLNEQLDLIVQQKDIQQTKIKQLKNIQQVKNKLYL